MSGSRKYFCLSKGRLQETFQRVYCKCFLDYWLIKNSGQCSPLRGSKLCAFLQSPATINYIHHFFPKLKRVTTVVWYYSNFIATEIMVPFAQRYLTLGDLRWRRDCVVVVRPRQSCRGSLTDNLLSGPGLLSGNDIVRTMLFVTSPLPTFYSSGFSLPPINTLTHFISFGKQI